MTIDLDLLLPGVSALAVLVNTVMGLVVATRPKAIEGKRQFPYEAAFVIVGVLGAAAIIWQGVRTADQSNRVEGLVNGISGQLGVRQHQTVQQQLSAISAKLDATTAQFRSAPPSAATKTPTGPTTSPLNLPSAKLTITKFLFGTSSSPEAPGFKFINIYLNDAGPIPAHSPARTYWVRVTDGYLSDAEVNSTMALLVRKAEASPPRYGVSDNQITAGQPWFFTLAQGVAPDEFSAILSGAKRVYVFALLAYRDDNHQRGSYWITEYCASQSHGEDVIEYCPSHNATWLHGA